MLLHFPQIFIGVESMGTFPIAFEEYATLFGFVESLGVRSNQVDVHIELLVLIGKCSVFLLF